MANHRRYLAYLAGLAIVGTLAATVLAGCGSTSSAAPAQTTSTGSTTATNGASGFAAFRTCLQQHGVTASFGGRRTQPPDAAGGAPPTGAGPNGTPPAGGAGGGFAGGGFRRNLTPAQQKAFTACRGKLPAGGSFGRGQGGRPGGGGSPAFVKYTACLRSHGVTFGATSSGSTKFKQAANACRSLLRAPASTGTTTG